MLASTQPSIRPPGSAFKAKRREAGDQDQEDEAVHLGVELPAQACMFSSESSDLLEWLGAVKTTSHKCQERSCLPPFWVSEGSSTSTKRMLARISGLASAAGGLPPALPCSLGFKLDQTPTCRAFHPQMSRREEIIDDLQSGSSVATGGRSGTSPRVSKRFAWRSSLEAFLAVM